MAPRPNQPRPRRQLNLRWLVGSIVLLALLVPGVYFWHRVQLRRVTGALLQRAAELEQAGNDQQAVQYLYRCLQLTAGQPELQRDLLIRLARDYDRSPELSVDKAAVIQWHYRALGAAPDDLALQLRLAELFLETRQYVLAQEQAEVLLQKDPAGLAAQRVRALARYGQLRSGRPVLAQQVLDELQDVQRRQPADVPVAETLAAVYREVISSGERFDPHVRADAIMDALVRAAPDDYRAYLARHRYRARYQLAIDERDVRRALELAPDVPEVILAAADEAQRVGNLDEARARFRQLLDVAPTEFRGYLGLGECLYRQGQLSEALGTWQNGLAAASGGRLPLRVRLTEGLIEGQQLAAAAAQLRELDQAIRFLTTTGGESQRDWVVASRDLLQARLHIARGEHRQAIPLLQRVATTAKADVSLQPEASPAYQAWLTMGQSLLELQQWEEAATSFQRALQIVPGSLTARIWAARAWSAVGRDDQAIVLCEQAAARDNAPDNVWLMLAQLHLRNQLRRPPAERDWQRLEQVLQRAATALPDSWEIPLVRANLLVLRDGDAGVGQAMQIVLGEENAHPNSVPLWSNLVFYYQRLGLASEADRALQHLQQIQPDAPQTLAWHAALLAARGEYAEAQAALDQAPPATTAEGADWLDRARLFLAYQQGELTTIREVLAQIQAQRPQNTQILAQLADLALAEGDWSECDRWIERLREAEGKEGVWWRFFQARRWLEGPDAAGREAVAQATARYDEVRRLRPWWPEAAMLGGMLAEAQGVPAEAAEAYATAVRAGMQQPHVYERLIRVLYQLGRFDEANQWLGQLQQEAPLDVRLLDLAWSAAVQQDQSELALHLARQNLGRHPRDTSAQLWLAQMLWMSGEREEAESLVQQVRQSQPRDLASWTGLLAYDLRAGRADEVRAGLAQLQQHPDLPSARYHAVAGYAYQQLGDRDSAEQNYREAIRLAPDDADLRLRYAIFLQPLDPTRAEAELRETLRRAPDHVAARQTLAVWLHGRDDPGARREAHELLQRSAGALPQQTSDRRLEAVLLLRRGRPEDLQAALDLLQQLVTEPRDATPEDRLLLGRLQERLGNLPAAEEQFKQLADAQPAAARHLAAYVDFLLRRPRLEEARAYLEQLERAAPISLTAVSLRSRLLLATGQAEQIDNYLESFAQTQLSQLHDAQQRQQFMLQVAGLFASVNRPAGAERWYRRLVAEFPQQRNALANFWMQNNQLPQSLEFAMSEVQQEATPATAALLARVLVRGDAEPAQLERAESIFRDVLQHSPDDADLLFSLASLRLKQNQLADAEQLLRQLTQRHPDHVIAWNNLAAILADDPERLAEAVTCIDRAIAAAGRPVANLLDTKAVILLRQDQNQEAAELLRQVLSLAGNVDPRFHFHLAVAQFRQGDLTSAKQAWQRAVQLGLDGAYLTGFERQLAAEMSAALTDPPAAAQGGA